MTLFQLPKSKTHGCKVELPNLYIWSQNVSKSVFIVISHIVKFEDWPTMVTQDNKELGYFREKKQEIFRL